MGWTKCQQFLLRASFIVGLGGFLFGYDMYALSLSRSLSHPSSSGIISGALQQLKHHFHLSNYEAGLVVSFLPLGSIFGCIFGGPLCDKIGRWWTIHLQNFTFIFGAIIMSTATSLSSLYLGRFILGIASALSAVADIPYLTEVSPSAYRGLVSSAYEILVVVGILVSFIIALCLVENNANSSWRIMFFVPISFSVIQSIGLLSLPESPQWLIENSQPEKAKIILEQIFDTPEEVLQRMDELTAHCSARLSGITLSSRIYFRQYLVPILVIVTLMFFQQFTGGVVVRNYAPKIFHLAGYGDVASLKFTVILGVVKVLVTGWAILRVSSPYLLPSSLPLSLTLFSSHLCRHRLIPSGGDHFCSLESLSSVWECSSSPSPLLLACKASQRMLGPLPPLVPPFTPSPS
jgi:MFS family permease